MNNMKDKNFKKIVIGEKEIIRIITDDLGALTHGTALVMQNIQDFCNVGMIRNVTVFANADCDLRVKFYSTDTQPTSLATMDMQGYVKVEDLVQETTSAGAVSGLFYQSVDCDFPYEDSDETGECHMIVENRDASVDLTAIKIMIEIEKAV